MLNFVQIYALTSELFFEANAKAIIFCQAREPHLWLATNSQKAKELRYRISFSAESVGAVVRRHFIARHLIDRMNEWTQNSDGTD